MKFLSRHNKRENLKSKLDRVRIRVVEAFFFSNFSIFRVTPRPELTILIMLFIKLLYNIYFFFLYPINSSQ